MSSAAFFAGALIWMYVSSTTLGDFHPPTSAICLLYHPSFWCKLVAKLWRPGWYVGKYFIPTLAHDRRSAPYSIFLLLLPNNCPFLYFGKPFIISTYLWTKDAIAGSPFFVFPIMTSAEAKSTWCDRQRQPRKFSRVVFARLQCQQSDALMRWGTTRLLCATFGRC